ncbi:membrane protein insertion efficiency factor YidD [Klebsiella sp. RHBSTW-00215]|uniref:membrane protein insertion efficiency factor YidD n=1 Tax=Klebsiella sp. RHBSTW-00215 TaxID=2742640 RepID=UPI001E5E3CE8|nr:membrane protein insertion efficiency factor YidD [Klebsiella sp. RHBSTW-00215]
MNNLILKFIVFYQRVISPRKGYRCAYGALHHTQGCSGAVKEIIQQKGVIGGWGEIRQRFSDCRLKLCKNKSLKTIRNVKRSVMIVAFRAVMASVALICRTHYRESLCRIWNVLVTALPCVLKVIADKKNPRRLAGT